MATILIADDRPTDRLVLTTLLAYGGHRLLEASNGVESLAIALSEKPDLVITDVLMPGMDGFEFVRLLREDPSGSTIPVIFYTATYREHEARKLAARCGVSTVLAKPAEPQTILGTIDAVLGRTPTPLPVPDGEFDRAHLRLVNEKLYQRTNDLESSRRLAALVRVWQQVAEEPSPQKLLEHCVRVARETVDAAFAAIGVPTADGSSFVHFITCGEGAGEPAPPEPWTRLLETLLADRRSLRMDENAIAAVVPPVPPARGFLGVSIRSPWRSFGWLYLLDKRGAGGFTIEDEDMAVILAAQVALAYENASRYDEIRRQKTVLEEADRRKDEFLAMLAHELRNPLSAMSNAVTVSTRSGVQDQIDWGLEVVGRQIRHLSRLIDDLLDVSRVSRGKIRLRKENIDALPVLHSAIEAVGPLIAERKHELVVSFSAGLRVEADPTRLEQIIVNLLTNSAKYSESGGRISLSATREAGDIVFTIRDTGFGFAPEKLPQMFELFVQGDRTLARSEGGLGIGLTLVRSLVELHGGTVTATSDGPGQGSEFVVRLPAASAARPARDGQPASKSPAVPGAMPSLDRRRQRRHGQRYIEAIATSRARDLDRP